MNKTFTLNILYNLKKWLFVCAFCLALVAIESCCTSFNFVQPVITTTAAMIIKILFEELHDYLR